MRDHGRMLSTFIRQPFRTGTVVPSSLGLAELMVEDMGLGSADTVVELGPGTGVFTRVIAERVRPDALVLAFEIDETLARELQQQMPRVRVVRLRQTWGQLRAWAARRPARDPSRACPGRSPATSSACCARLSRAFGPAVASRRSPTSPPPTSRRDVASARCSRRASHASRRHASSTRTSRPPSSTGA